MTGSEKQIAWATDILKPVRALIEQLPAGIRERHEAALDRLTTASTVINCRYTVQSWCERVQEWLDVNVSKTVSEDDAMHNGTPAAFVLAGPIDNVVF
ncbi:MAG: hypothetical protein WC683_20705 [bacterium]